MLGRAPHNWWRTRAPGRDAVCYPTKTKTLRAFYAANERAIDKYTGMGERDLPVVFEAVNHKYGTQARTLAEAIWAALPTKKRPYCLEDIDLEALNATDPGRHIGGFRLPDWFYEQGAAAGQEAYYRQQLEGTNKMARRRRSGPLTAQQKKFKGCAVECVGGNGYQSCMSTCLGGSGRRRRRKRRR